MSDKPTVGTQTQFARAQGWVPSYVSQLKREGRLVLTDDLRVDFEASLQRIRETTRAPARAAPAVQGADYSNAQARERYYASELKRLELEERIGKLGRVEDFDRAADDVAAIVRATVEAWRDRLPPRLASLGGDERRIEALLAAECEALLRTMADTFAKHAHEAQERDA
jgi:hypothetical protein